MAIGTGQVSVSDIATEMGGLGKFNTGTGNLSFADWSRKLWKGGPTDYASFKQVRSYGSNCTFSTVVVAQGTGLAGMNATSCGIGEWKGYTHVRDTNSGTTPRGRSTIGRAPTGNPAYTYASPLTHQVAVAGEEDYRSSNNFTSGSTTAIAGVAVWAEKSGSVVSIKLSDVAGNFANGNGSDSQTYVQQLGPNDGSGQTTTANTTGQNLPSVTLMTFTTATRITGCEVSLETLSYPGYGLSGNTNSGLVLDPDGGLYTGSKLMTVDHDGSVTTGATSTTNLGSTKIGYDLCLGGSFYFNPYSGDAVGTNIGINFKFTATNNDDIAMDEHQVTVYVSASADAEFDYTG